MRRKAIAWIVADGRLKEARLRLGAHLLDGRVAVVGGLPDGARVVTSKDAGGFRDGRAARLAGPEATP